MAAKAATPEALPRLLSQFGITIMMSGVRDPLLGTWTSPQDELSVPYRYDFPMDGQVVIEHAGRDDLAFLIQSDSHVRDMEAKVFRREILVARLNGSPVGWLRFNYFWDTIPFMNMLFVLAPHRGQSVGTRLVKFWEAEMLSLGYHEVLTSTQVNETAQHFYRKLGYIDVGGFLLPSEPNEELLLHKTLS